MFKVKKTMDVLPPLKNKKSEERVPTTELQGAKGERSIKETLIAKGTVLTGEISNESDVLVEGSVVGDIHSSRSIRIGQEGNVQGTLTAEKITINGYLKGRCQAVSVKILSQGRLDGDIHASELSIECGGIFNGNSQHITDKSANPRINSDKEIAVIAPAVVSETEPSNIESL
ncbi:bactofilin family protein [Rosenbergiella australiborealis]|uniref:bactofilin family protein n=1 Tax=Rosenbergiella australiborealis TaxID=1544696 RepID=UPI001F4E70DA|nr:polymer-forming cytoskeletal protein [Rosenbergiella australiborealis]